MAGTPEFIGKKMYFNFLNYIKPFCSSWGAKLWSCHLCCWYVVWIPMHIAFLNCDIFFLGQLVSLHFACKLYIICFCIWTITKTSHYVVQGVNSYALKHFYVVCFLLTHLNYISYADWQVALHFWVIMMPRLLKMSLLGSMSFQNQIPMKDMMIYQMLPKILSHV